MQAVYMIVSVKQPTLQRMLIVNYKLIIQFYCKNTTKKTLSKEMESVFNINNNF